MKSAWKLNWDSKGWEQIEGMPYSPKEWNQTLHTKISQISAQIHMSSLIGPADTIMVHPKSFCFILDLDYYDYSTKKFCDKYNVIVDDSIEPDNVYIYSKEIINGNMLDFYYPRNYNKSKAKGVIKILNYES